jgi:sugar-phosphatase
MRALAVLPNPTFQVQIAVAGLLFDMDGVLVRSTDGDERCWTRWAAHHGLTETLSCTEHGRRAADTIQEYFPELDARATADHLAQLDLFAAEELSGVIAYPGVVALLTRSRPIDGLL